jgi:cytochrome c
MTTTPTATILLLARLAAVVLVGGAVLAAGRAHAQDAAAGEKAFARCRACHQVGENARNGIGPRLNGIVGAHSAAVADYRYSDALKGSGLVWDEANLRDYLRKPAAKVPGTKMAYPGLPSDKDQADMIAYLARIGADGRSAP